MSPYRVVVLIFCTYGCYVSVYIKLSSAAYSYIAVTLNTFPLFYQYYYYYYNRY